MNSRVVLPATLWLVVCICGAAVADTVWNKQGTAIEGEVLSDEPDRPLVFRCRHKGEWKTFEISREQIQKYLREAGDQSDGKGDTTLMRGEDADPADGHVQSSQPSAASNDKARKGMHTCRDLGPLIEETLSPPKDGKGEVVVVHLNGPFARANIFDVGGTISFGVFNVLMDVAAKRNPAAIVLRINSGGGRVDQMDLIIEKVLEMQSPPANHRVVAWVNLGGSAAALTSLACKELVMMPQGRLGAATKTYGDGQAVEPAETALEQKQEAMSDARRRQIAAITGRPLAIQDAMEKPEHQFWHHPVQGFSLEPQDDGEWEPYDTDENKPLALDAQSLVDLQIASGIARDAQSLLSILKLAPDTAVVDIDLASNELQAKLEPARAFAAAGNKALQAFKSRLKAEVDDAQLAVRAAAGIVMAEDGYSPADLRVFRTAIAKCNAPTIDAKTREFLEASDPDMLAFFEERLATAKRVFQRARQTAADASRTGGIAVGAIIKDLEYGENSLIDIVLSPD
jgi:hypothetical protein